MASFIGGIVSLSVSVVVLANVFITTVNDTNTSGWDAGEIAMWGTLTIAGIAGLIFGVLQVFGLA